MTSKIYPSKIFPLVTTSEYPERQKNSDCLSGILQIRVRPDKTNCM